MKRPVPLLAALALYACSPGGNTMYVGHGSGKDAGAPTGECIDADGDGVAGTGDCSSAIAFDCDDADPSVHPGVAETCNGRDDDCDGQIDEGLPAQSYYPDVDGDGFGAASAPAQQSCRPVPGRAANADDCNDFDPAVHPGATEVCNGKDDTCDGQIDEGLPTQAWYPDLDSDGHGAAAAQPQPSCGPVAGKVTSHDDCDDQVASVHPGAAEACNGVDDDCNGQVDDGLPQGSYYPDGDHDGYGAAGSSARLACGAVAGFSASRDDCNDTNASIHPGAPEACDGVDQNCNGQVDEGLPTSAWYPDGDGDGHGARTGTPQQLCGPRPGLVASHDDCDDGRATTYPGAPELCNGLDDDCNGTADEGNPGGGASCSASQPGVCSAGTVTCQAGALRCVSNQAPSAERCDGLDNNCDGRVDETFTDKGQACAAGLGVCAAAGTRVCAASGTGTTCNATPGNAAAPACDGLDNDCDGVVDEPALGGTAQIHPNPWQDFEVQPYFYSASSCAGGVSGGSDALAGGGVAVSVQPGVGGIRYLQLDASGAPVGLTWILHSTYQYLDVDLAQAGDGFLVIGIYTPNPLIDFYYRSYAGTARVVLENQLKPATGNTLDSLRVVRGNGRRVVVLYRETGPVTASTGLKLAEVEPYYDATAAAWALRDGRTQAATLSPVTLVAGAVEKGLGADSTHVDWLGTQSCAPASSLRTLGVAYLASTQTLKYFTVAEDGSGKSAETTVRTETGARVLGEPQLTYFQSAGLDQWFVAYTTADTSMGEEDLNYWVSTNPGYNLAYAQPATANGADSVSRPRASVAGSRIWLTALRAVPDASGLKQQVAARWITFTGAKDPAGSAAEIPLTSGACATGQTDCRAGDKAGLGSWAATGRVFYSVSGAATTNSLTSVLSCD